MLTFQQREKTIMASRKNNGDFRDNVENWDGYNSKHDTSYSIYMSRTYLTDCYSTKEALGSILDILSKKYPNISFKFKESFGVVVGQKIKSQKDIDKFIDRVCKTIDAKEKEMGIDKKYKVEEEIE